MSASAKNTVKVIIQDVLAMFPPKNIIEQAAVAQFMDRIDHLSETQSQIILARVESRLTLTSQEH